MATHHTGENPYILPVSLLQYPQFCIHRFNNHRSWVYLSDPMDYSPLGSSVPRIFQVRVLEWVAIPFFQGISLTQGLNLHLLWLLHWQVDFSPLSHLESQLVLSGKKKNNHVQFSAVQTYVVQYLYVQHFS